MRALSDVFLANCKYMHKNSIESGDPGYWSGDKSQILTKEKRKMVVFFPGIITRDMRLEILHEVLDYAKDGFLNPNADHTHGEYVEVPASKFWKEKFPLRGCVYISRSLHQVGHTNHPSYPSMSLVGGSKKFSSGIKFLSKISPVAELSNYLIGLVDPDFHSKMVKLRETMVSSCPHVASICSVDPSLHTNVGVIVNRRSGSHTDRSDIKEGWAVMMVLGNFEGGELNLPQFGITSRYSPGDVFLIRAGEVEHMVKEWTGNIRVTLVYFTKESVWKEYMA